MSATIEPTRRKNTGKTGNGGLFDSKSYSEPAVTVEDRTPLEGLVDQTFQRGEWACPPGFDSVHVRPDGSGVDYQTDLPDGFLEAAAVGMEIPDDEDEAGQAELVRAVNEKLGTAQVRAIQDALYDDYHMVPMWDGDIGEYQFLTLTVQADGDDSLEEVNRRASSQVASQKPTLENVANTVRRTMSRFRA